MSDRDERPRGAAPDPAPRGAAGAEAPGAGRTDGPGAPGTRRPGPATVERVEVAVSPPYTVHVGAGALGLAPEVIGARRVAVVVDATVAGLHLDAVASALEARGHGVVRLPVPPGEGSKSAATWAGLLSALAGAGLTRDDAVLALGGGVTGDLAGFVAASYMRGVPVVQAPTTLLAMADAAIGGKTAINLPEGKNLAGAFWQPRAVLMDVATLRTLPDPILRQGAVEVFKHGLLADAALADAVLAGAFARDADDAELTRWVAASARVKAAVVAADERELGARAHLNLGHTLGHALEAASGHALAHGEAVAWGLLYAAHLSRLAGGADWTDRARRLLAWVRPRPLPTEAWEALAPYVRRDKKNRGGRQRWVLLEEVGAPYVADDVTPAQERDAWRAFLPDARASTASFEGGTT